MADTSPAGYLTFGEDWEKQSVATPEQQLEDIIQEGLRRSKGEESLRDFRMPLRRITQDEWVVPVASSGASLPPLREVVATDPIITEDSTQVRWEREYQGSFGSTNVPVDSLTDEEMRWRRLREVVASWPVTQSYSLSRQRDISTEARGLERREADSPVAREFFHAKMHRLSTIAREIEVGQLPLFFATISAMDPYFEANVPPMDDMRNIHSIRVSQRFEDGSRLEGGISLPLPPVRTQTDQ